MNTSRLRSIAKIAIFDVGGPLLIYQLLRANGIGTVVALVLSGLPPAAAVIFGAVRQRRIDAVGVLVIAGIIVGAILGLVSDNPKLVLDEGSVGTGVFGLICLGSLATDKPLMYRLAIEFIGPDSEQGREFAELRQYKEFRRTFVVMTVVWGTAYLIEAAARVVVVQNVSTGTALAVSKVTPWAFLAVLAVWTVGYGRLQRRKGERMAAAYAAQAGAGAPETDATSDDGETTPETGETGEVGGAAPR